MVTKMKNQTVALVKKFSNIKSFKDLKNQKACFSGYRDIGKKNKIYREFKFGREFKLNIKFCILQDGIHLFI